MSLPSPVEKASWIAGIVGTFFVAYSFFTDDSSSKDGSEKSPQSIIQNAGNYSTQVGINSGTLVITTPGDGKIEEPVDIQGSWNQAAALEIAIKKLQNAKFEEENFGPPPFTHELVGEYNLLYKDRQTIILSITTQPLDFECHACAPYLSFFEFEKRSRGWRLIHSDIAAIQSGSWGGFFSHNLSIRVIGSNQYGVFIEDGYTAQGQTTAGTVLYSRIGDRFRQILSLATYESTSMLIDEGESWNSTITLIPTDMGFYDILVERQGNLRWHNINGEMIEDIGDKKGNIRPKDIFKFDGSVYRRSDLFK